MARWPPQPTTLRRKVLPPLLALGGALVSYHLVPQEGMPREDLAAHLAAGPIRSQRSRAVERRWIDETFPRRYLVAPADHLPCPVGIPGTPSSVRISEALTRALEGAPDDAVALLDELHRQQPTSWVPGLALGSLLACEGRLAEAEVVLRQLLERQTLRSTIREALAAVRRGSPWTGPDARDVLAAIHLLHAASYVQIEDRRGGPELGQTLKDAIDCARLLAVRGETDRVAGTPVWAEHRLRSPGCEPSATDLTTLDLYNDLLVGYLRSEDFAPPPELRRVEFARSTTDPPHRNPLLAVLRLASVTLGPERESWLWAISTAERLLEQRRRSGLGEIADARLATNLAELTDSALEVSPPPAREALVAQRRSLVEMALRQRRSGSPRQRFDLDRNIARLVLIESVHRGAPPLLADEVASHLDQAQREVVEAVAFAVAARQRPQAWLTLAAGGGSGAAALGKRTPEWLSASRQDLAASFAERAAGGSFEERLRWIWRAREVLRWGDPAPAELTAAEADLGFWRRLSWLAALSSPLAELAFAAVVGALVWVASTWCAIQLGQRRALFTSFYRREAQARLRSLR